MESMKLSETYCSKKADSQDVPLPCPARDNTARTNLQWRKWLRIPIAALPARTIPGNGQLPSYTSQPADTPIEKTPNSLPWVVLLLFTLLSEVSEAIAQSFSNARFAAQMFCCLYAALMLAIQPDVHGTARCAWHSPPGPNQHHLGQVEMVQATNSRAAAWSCEGILSSTKDCPARTSPQLHPAFPTSVPKALPKQGVHPPLCPAP